MFLAPAAANVPSSYSGVSAGRLESKGLNNVSTEMPSAKMKQFLSSLSVKG